MRRSFVLFGVVALCLALSVSHNALAGKKGPAPKVDICHVTDSIDIGNGWTLVVGHVINVSENAIDAHLAHGDTLIYDDIDNGPIIFGLTWRQIAENLGLNTSGADSAAFVPTVD